jgi:hypothetical protein
VAGVRIFQAFEESVILSAYTRTIENSSFSESYHSKDFSHMPCHGNLPASINSTRLNQNLFAMNSQLHAGNEKSFSLHCRYTCVKFKPILEV